MPLFGPRLDRPSAIGDEGRPRATSLTIASVVVFAVVAATGWAGGFMRLTLALGTLVGLFTVGLSLLNRERFLALFLGQLCYVLGGTGLVGFALLVLLLAPAYGLVLTGFALALTGLATTWADVADAESTKTALFQGGASFVSMLVWFVCLIVVAGTVLALWTFLTGPATSVPPTPSLIVFLFALCVTGVLVWLGTRWLPFRQLTPRDRRPRLERNLGRFRLVTAVVALVAFAGIVVAVVAWLLGGFDRLYAALPPSSAVFGGLSSPFVLGPLLLVGVAVLATALVALALRRVTRPTDRRANQLLAAVVAGFAFTVLTIPFYFSVVPGMPLLRVVVAVLLVILGPPALFVAGLAFLGGVTVGVLPDRAGGPAVASAGMVVATVGAGLAGVPPVAVFACITAGMVAWDVSAFGLGVTADLGHIPETRRLELFHGVLGVGVGIVVVAVLAGVDLLRTAVAGGLVAGPAILLAVVAVLLLLIPVRG
ncbi:hypothetical protein SAMN05216559_3421 [Halomicrobium zhouii]|uniref:Uncharacterized protein n=1 Tax=Halomicrobium zhouii TaxID=767519 RepID=A0A1I6LY89_9EURY|nr:hypothetical protein [Halomicrobium zhouii]SFS08403.1 hypothetical protein SAMN05216559_3421 [Halomicrobium zhouii]